jgi:hypothetical protein
MFDVVYEDGTRRSNRKVPRALTAGIDGDKQAGARFSDRTGPSIARPFGASAIRKPTIGREAAVGGVRDRP